MLRNEFVRFLRDESGSYTLWSLIWFIMYVAIGGLAVDITDIFRNQSHLQATADASALAAVVSVGVPTEDPVQTALNYAGANMRPNLHGTVLTAQDVQIGTWHFSTEQFEPGTSDPNAVYVTTRRSTQNGNPVVWSLLRILAMFGVDAWSNVRAEAVAVKGVHICRNNGIIAGGEFQITTHVDFLENICLIGRKKFWFTSDVLFDKGVYVGVGCSKSTKQCIGPGGTAQFADEDFTKAFGMKNGKGGNYGDMTAPMLAEGTAGLINMFVDMAKSSQSYETFMQPYQIANPGMNYENMDFLVDPGPSSNEDNVYYQSVPTLPSPEDFVDHTVYEVTSCDTGNSITLPEGDYKYIGVVTDCKIAFPSQSTFTMGHTLIASRWTGNQAISSAGKVDFGAANCDDSVLMLSHGQINLAAAANVKNMRILSLGDVKMAGQAQGKLGIHIETKGNFQLASGSQTGGGSTDAGDWGLCENDFKIGPTPYSYSLVR